MLSRFKDLLERPLLPIARVLGRAVPPNAITLSGLLLSLAYLLIVVAYPDPILVVLLYSVSALVDALDGLVARLYARKTSFGAFLDSTVDRAVDAIHAFSLHALGVCEAWESFLYLVSAFIVSYARARAEGLGVGMAGIGLMERGERVALILLVILASYSVGRPTAHALFWLLTVLTLATALQRVRYAYRALASRSL